jgi:hypothetical protein
VTPDIKPFLLEADRRRPELAQINTVASAFELLQLTLALAGPEWQFVGKTATMDGASVTPAGFTEYEVELMRRDGQRQKVRITGVSQDAAWHVPSQRQVKVIAFSAANEPGPWEHGPAKLTPYEIDPEHYRWHNPPVPQGFGSVVVPPMEPPPPPPPAAVADYQTIGGDQLFVSDVGVPLEKDLKDAGQTMNAGSVIWTSRAAFLLMRAFDKHGDHREKDAILKSVRNEWRRLLGQPPL